MKIRNILLPLFLFVALLKGYSQTYYVSNSGSDGYTKVQAQNTATPWKTIQHACNNATPGTTIQIMAGTYFEQIVIPVSGSSLGGYITLTNYSSGKVTINGNAKAATLLTISSQSYIKIIGLEFYNCIGNNSIGIFMDGTSRNIEITNNSIHHIYWNPSVSAIPNDTENAQPLIGYGDSIIPLQNITIQGNDFYDNAPGFSENCTLDGNVNGFSIINNMVHNIQNIGILSAGNYGTSPNPATDHARNGVVKGNKVWKCHSVYDSSAAGIYVDGGEDLVIEQNECYNNDWGIEIGCENGGDTTANIKVRDNDIFRNGGGMQVGGYDGPVNTGRVVNSTISNNTFFGNDTLANGNGELSLSYSEGCSFYNNIMYSASDAVVSSGWNSGNSKGLTFDYNRYYSISSNTVNVTFSYGTFSYTGFANYQSGSGFDVHSLFANPSLKDTAHLALDLHLSTSSTCINDGSPTWPVDTAERDFDGNARIIAGRIDIGADEYQGVTGLQNLIDQQLVNAYPNPNNGSFNIALSNTINEKAEINIYNAFGQRVYSGSIYSGINHIMLNTNITGIYFYRAVNQITQEVISEGKLVVQN
ncbi:MAG TPA: right-handed parallel beta-helix repeat-containing protein [Bacteroidia bacterium]|jgi:hypothetical protein|nr:right-handed parallel beta-helix repeat-containing protein [Bacteroidia bacterium]